MVRSAPHEASLCARVWLVLAYSAVFEFPLTTAEVRRRYWIFAKELFPSEKQTAQALRTLCSMGCIKKTGAWWHLSSQPQAPKNRALWQRYSMQKKMEAKTVVEFLSKFPWVVGVAITGSVAVDSAKKDDDVDFLIVTKPNRLWLTRIVTLLFAIKHGKRRSFAHEEPNSWCFNLWLDDRNLFVPHAQHSLYTAYEVCQADWLINRHQIAEKFLLANSWAQQRLLEHYKYRQNLLSIAGQVDLPRSNTESILFPLLVVANLASYLLQLLYMLPHRTTERVGLGFAWFHPKEI